MAQSVKSINTERIYSDKLNPCGLHRSGSDFTFCAVKSRPIPLSKTPCFRLGVCEVEKAKLLEGLFENITAYMQL